MFDKTVRNRPADDFADCLLFTFGNSGTCKVQTVNFQPGKQKTGDLQLLLRGETYARSLFTIAERGVEYFNVEMVFYFAVHVLIYAGIIYFSTSGMKIGNSLG